MQGDVTLPNKDAMLKDIQDKRDVMSERFVQSARHTLEIDVIPFSDEIAAMVGCKPDISMLYMYYIFIYLFYR